MTHHMLFKNLCRDAEKNTLLFSSEHTNIHTHITHSSVQCAARDQLLQIAIPPVISLWVALTGRYLWFGLTNQIFCEGLYQNARCSVMWQIITCHKGSIIIVCWHMRVYTERPFLVFIIDRMSEKKMWWFISILHPPHKSIIYFCAVIPCWKKEKYD